jgi:hypothetical protein
MDALCVQVQPVLSRLFSEQAIAELRAVQGPPGLVENVAVSEGEDQGRFINILFTTTNARQLWPIVREQLIRLGLQRAAIVTCTGRESWRDYLLLHHFNPKERADGFGAL